MFLRSAHIRHYKSLDDVRVEFTQPITVIVGPNAVGKSNFVDALRFASEGVPSHIFGHSVSSRGGALRIRQQGAPADEPTRIQLMLLEERMQKFTGCTFSVQHDDRITLQFFEGKLFPLQFRKGLVCDKDIVKITDLSEGGKTAKVNVRIVSDNEIYLTVLQKFRTLDRSGIGHFYMCVRESFVETFQIRDQKIPADGVAGTDADLAAGRGCFHDLGFPALDQIDRRFDMTQKDLAFRGELNFFCASDEKNLIQFLFQCFNGLADSGL